MTHTKVTAVIIRHLRFSRPVTHAVKNFDISGKSKEETAFEIKKWFKETVDSFEATLIDADTPDFYLDVLGTINDQYFRLDF